MRKTVVKLSVVFSLVLLFGCFSALTVGAEGEGSIDSGYYIISNNELSAHLCVAESGTLTLAREKSASALFYLECQADGTYTVRSVSLEQYLSADDGAVLLKDTAAQISIAESEGGYIISSEDKHLSGALSEGGYTLGFSEGTSLWSIKEIEAEQMSLSLKEIVTRPYTAYVDLRCVVSPSYLADCVEWTSSDRNVAIVDEDGTFCALSEGTATLTASVGNASLTCEVKVTEEETFVWYSQNNVSTGGWNGDALASLRFSAGGVTKRYALNNSTKNTDWMSEGCAVCSIAQVLNNMGARLTEGYDMRSGRDGDLLADPYTVSLANIGHNGPKKANTTLWGDPILTVHARIASRFNVDGKRVSVVQKYSVTKAAIKEALDRCPWGVVVCFDNAAYGTHYITFNKCLNPDAKNPNDYVFTVSDPVSNSPHDSADVIFEQSYSYTRLRYRFYNAKLMQIWTYEQ